MTDKEIIKALEEKRNYWEKEYQSVRSRRFESKETETKYNVSMARKTRYGTALAMVKEIVSEN